MESTSLPSPARKLGLRHNRKMARGHAITSTKKSFSGQYRTYPFYPATDLEGGVFLERSI